MMMLAAWVLQDNKKKDVATSTQHSSREEFKKELIGKEIKFDGVDAIIGTPSRKEK